MEEFKYQQNAIIVDPHIKCVYMGMLTLYSFWTNFNSPTLDMQSLGPQNITNFDKFPVY